MPSVNGPDWSPRFLDGERAAPPEDAGGPPGFMRALEVLKDGAIQARCVASQSVRPRIR